EIASFTPLTIDENSTANTIIYDFDATDGDANATLIYSLSGVDASYFDINENTGEVTLLVATDFETQPVYNFDVIVSDGKYSDTQSVVLNVNDINEWEITDTNDLRWFDVASGVDIILNQSDYPVGPPQFDGDGNFTGYASNESQSPDDVNVIQLSNGNLAAVWSVDVWKELADGSWSNTSVSDVFYRVFNPADGSFITDEIRLTDNQQSDVIQEVNLVRPDLSSITIQPTVTTGLLGFSTAGTDLVWSSPDDQSISIILNDTKPQMNNGDPGSVNGYSFVELGNGHIAVSWNAATVKSVDYGSGADGIQDIYVRIFDPSTGDFVTEEINLTNATTNISSFDMALNDSGGFYVTAWSMARNIYESYSFDGSIHWNANGEWTSASPTVTTGLLGFSTAGTDLVWSSPDDQSISIILNDTKPQMNNGDPGSVNGYSFVELGNGHIAVSWNAATVKSVDYGSGADGIQDIYVRIFDPSTGDFVTEEINLTNATTNISSFDMALNDSGGFYVTAWSMARNIYESYSFDGSNFIGDGSDAIEGFEIILNDAQGGQVFYSFDNDGNIILANDHAPELITFTHLTIDENSATNTFIYDFDATDSDGNATLIYSLSGVDASYFDINENTGEVTLLVATDFETQPVYNFDVIVSDGKYSDTQSVVLNVNDIYENIAPIFTSSDTNSVDENVSVETIIYDADATDVEPVTFSLGGFDQDFLEIDENSGEVTLLVSPDYDTKPFYSFEVIASDGEFSSTKTVTVNVNDINDGASLGSQDDQLEINVSTTSHVSGLFDGGEGFDELSLTVDQNATNGVIVDYASGIRGELNSAFIIPYDFNPSDVAFEINNWEKLLLTDNSDYAI
ncbi:cadherin repeat domain-containing protein, partial [bacterium]|nr:cadherin repeat domain-containing protein [bacterium]